MSRQLGLVGLKLGMTRIFTEDGVSVPVTAIDVAGNIVGEIKRHAVNTSKSILVVAHGDVKFNRLNKPFIGQFSRMGIKPKRSIQEFNIKEDQADIFAVGSELTIESIFSVGQKVDVSGTSIGKGFCGVIKRHGFKSNRASHGNSKSHRTVGSTGMCQDPGKVFKGKKMPGHHGDSSVTIQNLKLFSIDEKNKVMLVRGAVPGCKGSKLIIRAAIKS